jgi:HK97 family phage portal protein
MAWWNRREPQTDQKALSAIPGGGRGSGWFSILESFQGAWQRNIEIKTDSVLSFHAVFACQSLIASDISKLPLMLMALNPSTRVWEETSNPAYSPVLRRPNNYQTTKQFIEAWVISKLQNGNTYILKQRDNRNVVVAMHVLDPKLVTVLVADNGDVFYQLSNDRLAGLEKGSVTVPCARNHS